jgi:hypothetical protein
MKKSRKNGKTSFILKRFSQHDTNLLYLIKGDIHLKWTLASKIFNNHADEERTLDSLKTKWRKLQAQDLEASPTAAVNQDVGWQQLRDQIMQQVHSDDLQVNTLELYSRIVLILSTRTQTQRSARPSRIQRTTNL